MAAINSTCPNLIYGDNTEFNVTRHSEYIAFREPGTSEWNLSHWRIYFLSHEFCKEWWKGGEKIRCFSCYDETPTKCADCHNTGYLNRYKGWKYHVGEMARLCNNLEDVAIYLKNNPKRKVQNNEG